MRRFSDRHGLQTLTELNVTPLLDLAFVLLLIFMITTPLMENSVDIVVPSSRSASNAVNPADVQTIGIAQNASLTLNGAPTDLESLEGLLNALKAEKPELAVVVRSHKTLPVQDLVDVMDVLQRAKIAKIGVVTTPEQK